MAIELVCSCGRKLRFEQALAGEKARCPACGALLTIPPDSTAGQAARDAPPQRAPKPLWALMGKAAPPDAPAAHSEQPGGAPLAKAGTEAHPQFSGDAGKLVQDDTARLAPADKTPESAPVRKGLWGMMRSAPAAAATATPESETAGPPSETAEQRRDSASLPRSADVFTTDTSPTDEGLAAIIGISPQETSPLVERQVAGVRQGRSVKVLIALGLGVLSLPLSSLALIDEFWTQMPAMLVGFTAILLAIQAASEIQNSAGRQTGREFVMAAILTGVVGVFVGPLVLAGMGRRMWQASARNVTEGHLGTIGQGLNRYYDKEGAFPPGGIFKPDKDKRQRGFHSWMTLLLPFIGEDALFAQIQLDRPFDDKVNLPAFGRDVEVFFAAGTDRSLVREHFGVSHFAGVGGDVEQEKGLSHAGIFGINSKVKRDDVTDGLSNTLAIGEVAHELPAWGDPDNWRTIGKGINRDSQGFGNHDRTGASFLMADGSVRFFSNKTSPRVMTALSTRDGSDNKDE